MPEKAIIQVTRKHSMFHLLRPMTIFIDDRKITTVDNHDQMKITVYAGTHEVYVTLDSYKTQALTVTVAADGVALLECGVKEGKTGFMAGLFNQDEYLFLRTSQDQSSLDQSISTSEQAS